MEKQMESFKKNAKSSRKGLGSLKTRFKMFVSDHHDKGRGNQGSNPATSDSETDEREASSPVPDRSGEIKKFLSSGSSSYSDEGSPSRTKEEGRFDSGSDSSEKKTKTELSQKSSEKRLQVHPQDERHEAFRLPPLEETPPSSPQSNLRFSTGAQSGYGRLWTHTSAPNSPANLSHNFNLNYRGGDSSPEALIHSLSGKESGKHVSQLSEISFAFVPSSSSLDLDDLGDKVDEFKASPSKTSPSLKPDEAPIVHRDEEQGVWRCGTCGWIYPNPNPSLRDRREHKKHCGEITNEQRWLGVQDIQDTPDQGAVKLEDSEVSVGSGLQEKPSAADERPMAKTGREDKHEGVSDMSTEPHGAVDQGRLDEIESPDQHAVGDESNDGTNSSAVVDPDKVDDQMKVHRVFEWPTLDTEIEDQTSSGEQLPNRSTIDNEVEDQSKLEDVSNRTTDHHEIEEVKSDDLVDRGVDVSDPPRGASNVTAEVEDDEEELVATGANLERVVDDVQSPQMFDSQVEAHENGLNQEAKEAVEQELRDFQVPPVNSNGKLEESGQHSLSAVHSNEDDLAHVEETEGLREKLFDSQVEAHENGLNQEAKEEVEQELQDFRVPPVNSNGKLEESGQHSLSAVHSNEDGLAHVEETEGLREEDESASQDCTDHLSRPHGNGLTEVPEVRTEQSVLTSDNKIAGGHAIDCSQSLRNEDDLGNQTSTDGRLNKEAGTVKEFEKVEPRITEDSGNPNGKVRAQESKATEPSVSTANLQNRKGQVDDKIGEMVEHEGVGEKNGKRNGNGRLGTEKGVKSNGHEFLERSNQNKATEIYNAEGSSSQVSPALRNGMKIEARERLDGSSSPLEEPPKWVNTGTFTSPEDGDAFSSVQKYCADVTSSKFLLVEGKRSPSFGRSSDVGFPSFRNGDRRSPSPFSLSKSEHDETQSQSSIDLANYRSTVEDKDEDRAIPSEEGRRSRSPFSPSRSDHGEIQSQSSVDLVSYRITVEDKDEVGAIPSGEGRRSPSPLSLNCNSDHREIQSQSCVDSVEDTEKDTSIPSGAAIERHGSSSSNAHVVYDLEKVVDEQNSHDFICPKCGSDVTKGIILRKRKRTPVPEDDGKLAKEMMIESGGADEDQRSQKDDNDDKAWECLACLSFFIRRELRQPLLGATGTEEAPLGDDERINCFGYLQRFQAQPSAVDTKLSEGSDSGLGATSGTEALKLEAAEKGSYNCLPDLHAFSWGPIPVYTHPPLDMDESPRMEGHNEANAFSIPGPSYKVEQEQSLKVEIEDEGHTVSHELRFMERMSLIGLLDRFGVDNARTESEETEKSECLPFSVFGSDRYLLVKIGTDTTASPEGLVQPDSGNSTSLPARDFHPVENSSIKGSSDFLPASMPAFPWGSSSKYDLPSSPGIVSSHQEIPTVTDRDEASTSSQVLTREPQGLEGARKKGSCNCLPELIPAFFWGPASGYAPLHSNESPEIEGPNEASAGRAPASLTEQPQGQEGARKKGSCNCLPELIPAFSWGPASGYAPLHSNESPEIEGPNEASAGRAPASLTEQPQGQEGARKKGSCNCLPELIPAFSWGPASGYAPLHSNESPEIEGPNEASAGRAPASLTEQPQGQEGARKKGSCNCLPELIPAFSWGPASGYAPQNSNESPEIEGCNEASAGRSTASLTEQPPRYTSLDSNDSTGIEGQKEASAGRATASLTEQPQGREGARKKGSCNCLPKLLPTLSWGAIPVYTHSPLDMDDTTGRQPQAAGTVGLVHEVTQEGDKASPDLKGKGVVDESSSSPGTSTEGAGDRFRPEEASNNTSSHFETEPKEMARCLCIPFELSEMHWGFTKRTTQENGKQKLLVRPGLEEGLQAQPTGPGTKVNSPFTIDSSEGTQFTQSEHVHFEGTVSSNTTVTKTKPDGVASEVHVNESNYGFDVDIKDEHFTSSVGKLESKPSLSLEEITDGEVDSYTHSSSSSAAAALGSVLHERPPNSGAETSSDHQVQHPEEASNAQLVQENAAATSGTVPKPVQNIISGVFPAHQIQEETGAQEEITDGEVDSDTHSSGSSAAAGLESVLQERPCDSGAETSGDHQVQHPEGASNAQLVQENAAATSGTVPKPVQNIISGIFPAHQIQEETGAQEEITDGEVDSDTHSSGSSAAAGLESVLQERPCDSGAETSGDHQVQHPEGASDAQLVQGNAAATSGTVPKPVQNIISGVFPAHQIQEETGAQEEITDGEVDSDTHSSGSSAAAGLESVLQERPCDSGAETSGDHQVQHPEGASDAQLVQGNAAATSGTVPKPVQNIISGVFPAHQIQEETGAQEEITDGEVDSDTHSSGSSAAAGLESVLQERPCDSGAETSGDHQVQHPEGASDAQLVQGNAAATSGTVPKPVQNIISGVFPAHQIQEETGAQEEITDGEVDSDTHSSGSSAAAGLESVLQERPCDSGAETSGDHQVQHPEGASDAQLVQGNAAATSGTVPKPVQNIISGVFPAHQIQEETGAQEEITDGEVDSDTHSSGSSAAAGLESVLQERPCDSGAETSGDHQVQHPEGASDAQLVQENAAATSGTVPKPVQNIISGIFPAHQIQEETEPQETLPQEPTIWNDSCNCLPLSLPTVRWWGPSLGLGELQRPGADVSDISTPLLGSAAPGRETIVSIDQKTEIKITVGGPDSEEVANEAIVGAQDHIPSRGEQSTSQEYLKSVVHGGLDVTLLSLGVVASAAGGDAKTTTVVAIGLAHLVYGIVTHVSNVTSLFYNNRPKFLVEVGQGFVNACLSILSFLFFGALAPVTYGFSFQNANTRNYKIVATSVVALVSIVLLGAANAHVKSKSAVRVISLLVGTGFVAAIAGFEMGQFVSQVLQYFGFSSV